MAQAGVTTFYEVGAGKVLAGLIKRIAEAAEASSIGTPDDIARFKTARGLNASRVCGKDGPCSNSPARRR